MFYVVWTYLLAISTFAFGVYIGWRIAHSRPEEEP
jgi:hypothetical protein